jgi:crotonobetainyl-CoA:carnitine CoA-transferase CaiB-like acyl-CoA transferase
MHSLSKNKVEQTMQEGILAGRRVLELGTMLAAPFAAHILGQLGAEVIKIEPPAGDPTRSLVRGGPSGTLIAYSRGKKSLCADLRTDQGRALFERLVASADIVVHNLAPDSARRLGVTYDACLRANPDLVYCHIRGYATGPQENDLASNPIVEASTGVVYTNVVNGRPSRLGPSYHDQFAGTYAVIGILAALLDNRRDSQGRKVEVGLYETGLHVAARDLVGVQLKKQLTGKADVEPSGEFSMPGYGAYETADGRWAYLVMLTDAHWQKFWQALAPASQPDPELATLRQRKKQRSRVEALVAEAVKGHTYEALARRFTAVGFGYTEVLSPVEVLNAPQAREHRKFSDVAFQGMNFETPDFPVCGRDGAQHEDTPPPLLGEHTHEILRQAGYSDADCQALLDSGAVVTSSPGAPLWAPTR